jgi:thymidylate synthase
MSANIISDNINEIFIDSLRYLKDNGVRLKTRGSEVCEVMNFTYELTNIRNNVLTVPFRYNNFPAICFETLWILSGCNHLGYLKYFLPNCVNYSDDGGETWGGAYSPRLRIGASDINLEQFVDFRQLVVKEPITEVLYNDQIVNVLKTLIEDRYSRQAMIIIGESNDYRFVTKTKDRPCNIALQFYIRNNKLHQTIFQRSGDCIWGALNINIFEWTTLQQIIADCLNIETGSLTHHITSFHYYVSQHEKMINKVLNNTELIPDIYSGSFDINYDKSKLKKEIDEPDVYRELESHYANVAFSYNVLTKMIDNKGENPNGFINNSFIDNPNNIYIKKLYDSARLFILLKNKRNDEVGEFLLNQEMDIYGIALFEYAVRYCSREGVDLDFNKIIDMNMPPYYNKEINDFIRWSSS